MSEASSRRLALYNRLTEQLGPDLADALMTFLPATPAEELATKADISLLEDQIAHLDVRMGRVEGSLGRMTERLDDNFDRLSRRIDRLHYTMMAGFVALTTALIAAGFLG